MYFHYTSHMLLYSLYLVVVVHVGVEVRHSVEAEHHGGEQVVGVEAIPSCQYGSQYTTVLKDVILP
jgi:hypothetical protein